MEKQAKKSNNEILSFVKTFLIALAVVMVITTPAAAFVGRTLDMPILGGGSEVGSIHVIEEEMDILIPDDSPFFEAFTNSKKVNILLLGVNSGLTDTIMLACFDIMNKHVDIIWVPRDTYYHRNGYYGEAEHKINAAYRKNPVNSAKAVSEVLQGIPINYYVVLDYEGVAKIVDSMGGVPMDIPFDMKYRDPLDKPPLVIDLKKGQQVLNGEQAVQFLRYRKGYIDADLGRIKAQEQFMKNAFKQCLSFELPKIATTAYNNVTSDITLRKALYLASKGVGVSADDIETYMMPNNPDPDPPYYVYPKAKEISEMLTEIYSLGTAEEEEGEPAHEPAE
ncbi:MAG: LCP family protein [Clostridiales bacterium]|nr:LCP family protein [Clostridiales bacterium]